SGPRSALSSRADRDCCAASRFRRRPCETLPLTCDTRERRSVALASQGKGNDTLREQLFAGSRRVMSPRNAAGWRAPTAASSCMRFALVLPALALPVAAACAQSNSKSQLGVVGQSIAGARVEITYRRPVARGRDLFGALVPWGRPWTP